MGSTIRACSDQGGVGVTAELHSWVDTITALFSLPLQQRVTPTLNLSNQLLEYCSCRSRPAVPVLYLSEVSEAGDEHKLRELHLNCKEQVKTQNFQYLELIRTQNVSSCALKAVF